MANNVLVVKAIAFVAKKPMFNASSNVVAVSVAVIVGKKL